MMNKGLEVIEALGSPRREEEHSLAKLAKLSSEFFLEMLES